ncbi:MAG: HEAT repeat domain-containing protein [Gemmatimonadota bacterium]|jgi:HEAT repeat protein
MRTLTLVLILATPLQLGAQVAPVRPVAPVEPTQELQAALAELQAQLEPVRARLEPLQAGLDMQAALLPMDAALAAAQLSVAPLDAELEPVVLQAGALASRSAAMAENARAMALRMSDVLGDWRLDATSTRELPPAASQQQSPADSLYRAARDAMSRSQYDRAAELFARIADRYPRSAYAPDAYYWLAFNLYRSGGGRNLEQALKTLERQRVQFPDASTRRSGDAETLATRIRGVLARQGDSEAAAQIAERAQQAEAGCDTVDQDMRVAALNALLQMNAEQALPILKKVLQRRDACSTDLRRKAVFLLSQKETPETVDIMMDVAKNDPDIEVRRQAVFWLSQVDDPRAVDALEQILRTSKDVALQKRALFALSQHDSPRAYAILKHAAENQQLSEDLRKYAITWIAQHKDADVTYLEQLYGKLQDQALKERVLFAVSQSGQPGAADWLLGVATDTAAPMDVRKHAIFWASQADASITAMSHLYDRVQNRELKEQLLFAFSQSDNSAAVDKLIQVAKTEKDPDLRKRAIFWLGQSDDPRAAKVLADIIGG